MHDIKNKKDTAMHKTVNDFPVVFSNKAYNTTYGRAIKHCQDSTYMNVLKLDVYV